jgi:O-antigen ligase
MVWGHRQASWCPDLPNTVRVYHAHNGYVQLAAELGVVAAALALLLVRTLIVQAFVAYAATGSAFAPFCLLYSAMFAVGNLFTALAVTLRARRRPERPAQEHGGRLTTACATRHAKEA